MSHHIDEQPIADAVVELFATVESDRWDAASTLLADHVHLTHGPQGMTLSRENLITGWKERHTAYASTTDQLGPLAIEHIGPREATVRCSARATLH